MTEERTEINWAREFQKRRVEMLKAKDAAALVASYGERAALVSFSAVVHGRTAIQKHFENYFAALDSLNVVSLDNLAAVQNDAIFWEATIVADGEKHRVYDAFAFVENLIERHFTGVMD